MSNSIAMKRLANRDRSTQVGNSVQLSAGYSFPDLKQSSGGRNSLHIRLLIDKMTIRAQSSLWRGSQQPNAVRRGKLRINCRSVIATRQPLETRRKNSRVQLCRTGDSPETGIVVIPAELATGHRR